MKLKPFYPLRLENIKDLAVAIRDLAKRFNDLEPVIDSSISTFDDVTSSSHGFVPKSPGDATKFLNGADTPVFAKIKDSDIVLADIATNDATVAQHGFMPKLSGQADEYLDGMGLATIPRVLRQRTQVIVTTAVLATNASEQGVVALAFSSCVLYVIQSDTAARVRLYGTAAEQAADLGRAIGVAPAAGIGLQAEFQFSAPGEIHASPIAPIANQDSPAAHQIYYTIENRSAGATAVQVTLIVLPVEA